MKRLILLLSSVIQILRAAKMTMKPPVTLPFDFKIMNSRSYGTLTYLFAAQTKNQSLGFPVRMLPDFSEPKIFLGDLDELSWGIDCETENLCEIVDNDPKTCSRVITPALTSECKRAETYLRFRDQKIPADVEKLQIHILQDDSKWKPKPVGILGLSPKSPFWSYIANSLDNGLDFMDISFFYRATDIDQLNNQENDNYKNAIASMNGNGIAKQPDFINLQSDKDYWYMIDAFISDGKAEQETRVDLCFANSINLTFVTNDFIDYRTKFFTQLCGDASGCTRIKSRINSVDDLVLKMYNKTEENTFAQVTIEPEELFYFDEEGEVVLLFGDIADYPNQCLPETTLALGMLAFGKREIIFRYWDDGKMQIGIQEFEPSIVYLTTLLVLASILVGFFLVICLFTTCSRLQTGKTKDEIEEFDKKNEESEIQAPLVETHEQEKVNSNPSALN